MKRSLAIAILAVWSTAVAQPGKAPPPSEGDKPKRQLPVEQPQNPYGPAPDDPYADPPPPRGPSPTPPAAPSPPAKAPAPAKAPPGAKTPAAKTGTPDDPYGDPATPPATTPPPVPTPLPPPATTPPPGKAGPPPATMPPPGKAAAPPAAKTPPAKEPPPKEIVPSAIPSRVTLQDLTAIQGLLAVQRLDGWLMFDRDGGNPISARLVSPEGHPSRPWFYLIPAKGEALALVHTAEVRQFDHLPGKKLTYQGYRDLAPQLKALLKGTRTVAVEYSAKAAVPSVSRVDAGTLELIRAAGVQVRSSDTLVQYTKAIWGDPGRTAHYVAVHHMVELRKDALAFIAKQLAIGAPISEYDVQQRLSRGMTMRGLVGQPPVVAAGANTADPFYVPTAARTAPIKRGDLIVLSLAMKVDKPEGIWAVQTWVAVAEAVVPEAARKAFETAALARDQALALIADRSRKKRPVTGAEVDDATRAFFKKLKVEANVMHRTGHSIDNDFSGGGADLDNFEVKDTRILTPGTGFTVGPGLYFPGQFGVRTEVSVYLAPAGPEVTTPAQDAIEPLIK
ncbi:MAG: aminopeptidase P family protein [Myxococcales bacterium]|nr:aminopeptidase P family protein [Myxococcales bacterium]